MIKRVYIDVKKIMMWIALCAVVVYGMYVVSVFNVKEAVASTKFARCYRPSEGGSLSITRDKLYTAGNSVTRLSGVEYDFAFDDEEHKSENWYMNISEDGDYNFVRINITIDQDGNYLNGKSLKSVVEEINQSAEYAEIADMYLVVSVKSELTMEGKSCLVAKTAFSQLAKSCEDNQNLIFTYATDLGKDEEIATKNEIDRKVNDFNSNVLVMSDYEFEKMMNDSQISVKDADEQ